jgi:hypothetical protein
MNEPTRRDLGADVIQALRLDATPHARPASPGGTATSREHRRNTTAVPRGGIPRLRGRPVHGEGRVLARIPPRFPERP